jgi:membrane AbrB-like protein
LTSKRFRSLCFVVLGWFLLVTVCYVVGAAARSVGVPSAHLVVSLLIGVIAALAGLVQTPLPKRAKRGSQAVVGVLMGSYLDPDSLRSVADSIVPLSIVTVATIGLCVLLGLVLPKVALMTHIDAVVGMVPGGSAAIISCAEDLNADGRVVAFMQYLRVGLVAVTAPAVVLGITSLSQLPAPAPQQVTAPFVSGALHVVDSPQPVAGLLILAGLCALGCDVGRRLTLPAPALLGPMLLSAISVFTGAAHGFAPTGMLQDVVFALVGLEVGLRFTRSAIIHVKRIFPLVLAATVLVYVLCGALAAALAALTRIPLTDAYLATTPGGINAVLATATSMHSHVALISTTQSLRLFFVVLLGPPLIRMALKRTVYASAHSRQAAKRQAAAVSSCAAAGTAAQRTAPATSSGSAKPTEPVGVVAGDGGAPQAGFFESRTPTASFVTHAEPGQVPEVAE